MSKQIGDVNSDAKGSGARYNAGKPDFSLLPLCTLEDEIRVWEYGRRKYSARGDCTCSAGNAARKLLDVGVASAPVAAANTKKSCGNEIPNTLNDSTLTTTTQADGCGEYSAIAATLVLDFSKGLVAGLSVHSPTCGVHKIVQGTGVWNWAKGMDWEIPFACALRHMAAWQAGEELDAESGLPHLAHAMCNLRMLTLYAKTFPEGDHRASKWLKPFRDFPKFVDATYNGPGSVTLIDDEPSSVPDWLVTQRAREVL